MTTAIIYAVGSVVVVSLLSLAGIGTLAFKQNVLRYVVTLLIGLAIGAMLGDAFFHLLPEAFHEFEGSSLAAFLVLGAILLFLVLEKFLHWHHGAHGSEEHEQHTEGHPHSHQHIQPVGRMILISDGVHNLIDGVIIGASYLVSIEVGIATTIAVALHEIPQEIGDFGVLVHAGYTRGRALLLNFISALAALVGVAFALIVGGAVDGFVAWMLPIAAGTFIYIASADLIPELHKQKGGWMSFCEFLAILLGIGAMYALVLLEGGGH